MNPEVYLDRLIEQREAGDKQFSVHNDEIASSLQAAEMLTQLQKIDVPPAFAHRLELSIRVRTRSQRLTYQNGQSISTGPLSRPVNPHRVPKRRYWAALSIAVILVLAFTALVATFTGNLPGSPATGSNPGENWFTDTFPAHPPNNINDMIGQLHNSLLNLVTVVNNNSDNHAILQAFTSVSTRTIDCQKAVAALPAGTERDADQQNLNSILAEENQTLRNLLNHVDWTIQLDFTQQLGTLGDSVPHVTQGMIHTQNNGTLLVMLTGTNFAPHAKIIVDGRVMGAVTQSTSWQLVAVINRSNWFSGTHAFGILNPDGTADQIVLKGDNTENDK